jgi:hypothetical protein
MFLRPSRRIVRGGQRGRQARQCLGADERQHGDREQQHRARHPPFLRAAIGTPSDRRGCAYRHREYTISAAKARGRR